MTESSLVERLTKALHRSYHEADRPDECPFCACFEIWWNGSRKRGGKILFEGRVVEVDFLPCRRVRCKACKRSWTLLPDGLLPGRQVGLLVATKALSEYLFGKAKSLERAAREHSLSPRTLGRIRDWVARLASPALLQGLLVERAGEPIVGHVVPVADLERRAKCGASRSLLERAAKVLCLLESLAHAAGLAAPGLASLVGRAVSGRRSLALLQASPIPERAWRQALGLSETMAM